MRIVECGMRSDCGIVKCLVIPHSALHIPH